MPPADKQKAAELALKRKSALLTRLGAHSFSVGYVTRGGKREVGIVANFERKAPRELPATVDIKVGTRTVTVPVKGRSNIPRFSPDG